jgi:hypothetical protein
LRAAPSALGGCDDEGALAAITFPVLVAVFIAWPGLEKRILFADISVD